jgi:hypothetical protein
VARRRAALAATEPSIEFTVGGGGAINLTWGNVETVHVGYIPTDVGLRFRRDAFVKHPGNPFAPIKPNASADLKLPSGRNKVASASLGRPANCGTGRRHIRRPDESSTTTHQEQAPDEPVPP